MHYSLLLLYYNFIYLLSVFTLCSWSVYLSLWNKQMWVNVFSKVIVWNLLSGFKPGIISLQCINPLTTVGIRVSIRFTTFRSLKGYRIDHLTAQYNIIQQNVFCFSQDFLVCRNGLLPYQISISRQGREIMQTPTK